MYKRVIETTIIILIVILIIIATTIIFKPKTAVKENTYEDVIISLMQTKKIGVYTKGATVRNTKTNVEKVYEPNIINNITDYKEIQYFINLIKDCPLIIHKFISASVAPNERLYMYDENNKELLWIEVDRSGKIIEIGKDKDVYYLRNKYLTKINDFLKKYINYEF